MGMFKKKSRSDDSARENAPSPSSAASYPAYSGYEQPRPQPNSSPSSNASAAPSVNGSTGSNHRHKKKGFGSKLLKGLVKGSSSSKRSLGGSSNSVGGSSLNPDDDIAEPTHGNHHRRVAPNGSSSSSSKVQQKQKDGQENSSSSSSDDEDQFHQELGTVAEVNEDDYDSDGELKPKTARTSPSSAATAAASNRRIIPARTRRLGSGTEDNLVVETITLVILLVDIQTKRFELLQFQQLNDRGNKGIKVRNVLEQFKTCITEPELKRLPFIGLVDRLGKVHKPDARLKAVAHEKDILVGLVRGVPVEQLMQSVRPILGDPKMGKLLEMNGFATKGWVKKKKTKDSILDKRSLVQPEKQGSTLSIIAFALIIAVALMGMDKYLVYLDQKGFFIQPLPDWPQVMESAGDLARQGAQAAKEAMQGNSTAAMAMANSTFAAMEESALVEAVAETATAMVKYFVPAGTAKSPEVIFDTAKNMVQMAAVSKVAEVVSEATTNMSNTVSEVVSNVPTKVSAGLAEGISSSTITNATTEVVKDDNNNNATTSTPKSVWEDYILIGLLVCWFLYWMAI